MSESERFRFGKIDLPDSELPTPDEVYSSISDTFEVREEERLSEDAGPLEFMEKGTSKYQSSTHDDYPFCHFYYQSETNGSTPVRNDDNEVEEQVFGEIVSSRVLYFGNGQFAYETRQQLEEWWIPQFIGRITETDITGNVTFYDFSQDTMKDFYDSHDHISIFKFGTVEDEEFEGSSTLIDALNELTEQVESQEFSGGQSGKNLKGIDIVDEAAEKMSIKKLHGAESEGYVMNIVESGTFSPAWSEKDWPMEAGTERRAETISRHLLPYLRKLDE